MLNTEASTRHEKTTSVEEIVDFEEIEDDLNEVKTSGSIIPTPSSPWNTPEISSTLVQSTSNYYARRRLTFNSESE